MRRLLPVTVELDDDEPDETLASYAALCPTCFAVVPSNRLADHQRAAHGGAQ